MSASAAQVVYRVRIHYREPTYDLYAGHDHRNRPYRWTYEVSAGDAEEAKRLALEEFESVSQSSGVGWRRQIVLIEIPGGRDT